MSDISNLRDTIVPKSDQLNAEQLLAGPMTITVTDVERGSDEQPIIIHYEGDGGRPYKPCKSMRKVLIFAWGEDGREWVGRSMVVFNDPAVRFGGMAVGGIRVSHLTDIDRDISLSLTATKGKKTPFLIQRMQRPVNPADKARAVLIEAAQEGTAALVAAWKSLPAPVRKLLGSCPDDLKQAAASADAARAPAEPEAEQKDPAQ